MRAGRRQFEVMRRNNDQPSELEKSTPWNEFTRRLVAGQGPGNQAVNTSTREAVDDGRRQLPQPSRAFDAALEQIRAATGHALHDAPLTRVRSKPAAPTLPWGAPPPRLRDEPREPSVSQKGLPPAMVPDAAKRLGRLVGWLAAALVAWEQHRMIVALRRLDDRLLNDMGLNREDLRGGERSRDALRRLGSSSER